MRCWPLLVLILTACAGLSPHVAPRNLPAAQALAAPCADPAECADDPAPDAPGYYLGPGITPAACASPDPGFDADRDGLADTCEYEITRAFAPEFSYWTGDAVGREPYWVARWRDSTTVRVIYMLGYYVDLGHRIFGYSHYGDSEKIFLDARYDPATRHWVLYWIAVTAHSSTIDAVGRGTDPPETYTSPVDGRTRFLTYARKVGGHLRVWVAQRSHGSYLAADECENGAAMRTDTCRDHDAVARDLPQPDRNAGSRAHPLHDCVATGNPRHPHFGAGRLECFWTVRPFRGWYPAEVGGGSGGTYASTLEYAGF